MNEGIVKFNAGTWKRKPHRLNNIADVERALWPAMDRLNCQHFDVFVSQKKAADSIKRLVSIGFHIIATIATIAAITGKKKSFSNRCNHTWKPSRAHRSEKKTSLNRHALKV